jgi:hypothetical protein
VLDMLIADFRGTPDPKYPDHHERAQQARLFTREHGARRAGDSELSARLMVEAQELNERLKDEKSGHDPTTPGFVDLFRVVAKQPRARKKPAARPQALPGPGAISRSPKPKPSRKQKPATPVAVMS